MNNIKQKILIVHNFYQIPGGEDTVVANEKKLLEDNGHEVVLYTRHNLEIKTMSKFKKLLLPVTTVFNLKTYIDIKKIIKEQNINILHVHNTLTLISPSIYYASLKCKIPVIQTIHNFRLLCPGATFYRDGHICEDCVTKGLKCAVKHSCYRNSKLQTLLCFINTKIHKMTGIYGKINYICLTEFNKEKLLQFKEIKREQIFVKPNFVKNHETIIPYEKRNNQYIYAGRLDKLKGIDILFEAWKQIGSNAPKLIICGTGPLQDWCREFILKNNMKSIELKGFVLNEETKKIIANSKALILPTQWYEGFPMTIVEAYSVEIPVIGSNIGNVGILVDDGINGFKFKYDSLDDLLKAIKKCESSDRKVMGENAYFKYKNEYSDETNYSILKDIYCKVIS